MDLHNRNDDHHCTSVYTCLKCLNGINIAVEVRRLLSRDHATFRKARGEQMLTFSYPIGDDGCVGVGRTNTLLTRDVAGNPGIKLAGEVTPHHETSTNVLSLAWDKKHAHSLLPSQGKAQRWSDYSPKETANDVTGHVYHLFPVCKFSLAVLRPFDIAQSKICKRNCGHHEDVPCSFRDGNDGLLVTPTLWSKLKYLSNHRMDWRDILHRRSWCRKDDFSYLWWFPDLSSRAVMRVTFMVFEWNVFIPKDQPTFSSNNCHTEHLALSCFVFFPPNPISSIHITAIYFRSVPEASLSSPSILAICPCYSQLHLLARFSGTCYK